MLRIPFLLQVSCLIAGGVVSQTKADDPASQAPTQQEIAAVILQLGDDDYATREAASKKIVQFGLAAEPQLREAQRSPDFEIRVRSARALQTIEASPASTEAFKTQVQAFVADLNGDQKRSLPGWERFREIMGTDDAETRAYFAEIQCAERSLLRAYGEGTLQLDPLSETLYDQCCIKLGQPAGQATWAASLGALLLVAADEKLALPKQSIASMTGVLQSDTLAKTLESKRGTLLKKLLTYWICSQSDINLSYIVLQHKLGEAGLAIATKILTSKDQSEAMKFQCLLALTLVARFGNQEHLAVVEPLLDDKTAMGENVQIRDFALGVLVHLRGQELRDYGFKKGLKMDQGFEGLGTALSDGFFGEGQDRDEMISQWRAWAKTHPVTDPK